MMSFIRNIRFILIPFAIIIISLSGCFFHTNLITPKNTYPINKEKRISKGAYLIIEGDIQNYDSKMDYEIKENLKLANLFNDIIILKSYRDFDSRRDEIKDSFVIEGNLILKPQKVSKFTPYNCLSVFTLPSYYIVSSSELGCNSQLDLLVYYYSAINKKIKIFSKVFKSDGKFTLVESKNLGGCLPTSPPAFDLLASLGSEGKQEQTKSWYTKELIAPIISDLAKNISSDLSNNLLNEAIKTPIVADALSKDHNVVLAESMSVVGAPYFEDSIININNPHDGFSTFDDSVMLIGTVICNKEISKVNIKLNGKDLKGFIDDNIKKGNKSLAIDSSIPLEVGKNFITVTAFDGSGRVSQKMIKINREISGGVVTKPLKWVPSNKIGQKWAIVIGISDYKYSNSEFNDLKYADKDAEEFYKFLLTPAGGNFSKEHILFLKNDEATKEKVEYALFDFLNRTIEEDLVIIYFAGHGAPHPNNPENLYFLTYDTHPEKIASTAFPMWDIETALERYIKAQRVVIIADACHSAGVAQRGKRDFSGSQNQVNKYLQELAKSGKGRAIFTASEASEQSLESKDWGGGHGVFTYFLLEGLKGKADFNNDGIVTLGEVMDYTDENVRRETGSSQHPDTAGMFDRNLPMAVLR